MFKKYLIGIYMFSISIFHFNCAPSAAVEAVKEPSVLVKFNGENITLENFNQQLEKNHSGPEGVKNISIEEKQKFLDLYLSFRLKVKEAYKRGYNKNPEIISELTEYKKNLAVSYMLEKEMVTPQIQKYYSRQKEELRASHILLNINQDDTILVYNKALAIIDSLNKKLASFEDLALRNSQDPSVINNKGDLYFFTSGAMVPEFEEVAFNLKVGEVSQKPVKTQFGYHIIKITERQKNRGKINIRHIMKSLTPMSTAEDSVTKKREIYELLDSVKAGISVEELATKYSDDAYSKEKGGDLGFFPRRSIVAQFEELAFKLKKGEISGVVQSPFGYHIMQLVDEKEMPSYKEAEPELRTTYQQWRYPQDLEELLKKLKKNYLLNQQTVEALKKSFDTTKSTADVNWDSTLTPIKKYVLFTIAGEQISVDSFVAIVKIHPELRGLPLKESYSFENMMEKITQKLLLEYEARKVDKNYPEFANLMKEYEEGVLLFKIEQDEVWEKLAVNQDSLKLFWEERKHNYTLPDRVKFTEVFVTTDSVKKIIENEFLNFKKIVNPKTKKQTTQPKKPISFDSAAAKYNERPSTISTFGKWDLLATSTNELTQKAWDMEVDSVSQFFAVDGGFSKIRVDKKDSARIKTFEEATPEISSLYQEHESNRLRNNLAEWLRKKYNPTIVKETLQQILQ